MPIAGTTTGDLPDRQATIMDFFVNRLGYIGQHFCDFRFYEDRIHGLGFQRSAILVGKPEDDAGSAIIYGNPRFS